MLSCRDIAPWLNTHSPTACGGKVVAPATKGGMHFQRPQSGCPVFAAKGGIYTGAPKGAHLASAAILYTSRGRSPQPVREASAGPGQNPWRPGPRGPAAPSTLTPVRACQPSGIPESTAQVPVPIPTAPQALTSSLKKHRFLPVLFFYNPVSRISPLLWAAPSMTDNSYSFCLNGSFSFLASS